jgi:hypothetical protein
MGPEIPACTDERLPSETEKVKRVFLLGKSFAILNKLALKCLFIGQGNVEEMRDKILAALAVPHL